MRQGKINRETLETKLNVTIDLDGQGTTKIETKIGFFDHMLTLFGFHGGFDLDVFCDGDIEVDSHHSIEDVGIALGLAFKEALGDKKGINRYGSFRLVMDEALVSVDLDISARPYLVFNGEIPKVTLGNFDCEMTEEFLRAFAFNAGITLHVNVIYGKNVHHIIEAIFKALARALNIAVAIDPAKADKVSSTKGML